MSELESMLEEIERAHRLSQVDAINSAPGLLFMSLPESGSEGLTLGTAKRREKDLPETESPLE